MKKAGSKAVPTARGGPKGKAVPGKKLREPAEVQAGLFMGSQRSSGNVDYLRSLNITHILSVGVDTLHPTEFTHKRIKGLQDADTSDLLSRLPECIAFIEEALQAGSGVLVHCQGGISRSAAVVVGFLVHSNRDLSANEALALLHQSRPTARPRPAFLEQVEAYRRSLLATASAQPPPTTK
ncbi:dual specificity phosphatase, catalytic domain containing protein [Acanthamoeba castellanii str. Neff]|uniref:Dual specificity phosphatase, catalytic domain containing protein n=1 Tax=Acanthamoeba castellanii (strain ATCC 30010 / Neff) TaxID=1257118 RepID=L8GSL7_ACACF|nr:dual specificity phosphatase, catalytic domain containing protein [Acanthamoeba castellanii str. Neff]ELR16194.1 dual specificity phosphatase, catalytic domain containing protein [Acanthamoeba castellanii str. Neff]